MKISKLTLKKEELKEIHEVLNNLNLFHYSINPNKHAVAVGYDIARMEERIGKDVNRLKELLHYYELPTVYDVVEKH